MPKPVILFEHESKSFEWTRSDLVRLARLNDTLGYEALRLSVKGGQHVVQATQFVGVVRLGRHTIQVLPKIHAADAPKSEQVRQATHNLLHLLAEAGYVTVREHAVAPLHKRDSDWFEILTHLFATHLKDEWQRGAYRAYQAVDDDLGVLKGKWRVAERARRPARDHQIGHSYLLNLGILDDLHFAWYHRIVSLLQEYFYNDGERLRAVLGAAFMEEIKLDTGVFESSPDFLDGDATRWEVQTLEGDAFVAALKKIAGVNAGTLLADAPS